ncbi:hypothetical protein JZ751_014307 [Albula glossodonta]|uniref:E3 ubiquitin-protein ligase RNF220 middle domain-containing protein n=1 Tax=Albula glossodonta TaxID=121402 RepID=A0A8T2NUY8_9TELE|nr:hypothetical protein JZ751_014307 [Albula glossodonta]
MEEERQTNGRRETFLRVRANRQTRLNVDDLCWCRRYAKESVKTAPFPLLNGAPLAPCCIRHARIGKMKRRKPEDGQREGACGVEDDSADVDGENGTPFEEYEWCGQKRVRATSLLEGGFRECAARLKGARSLRRRICFESGGGGRSPGGRQGRPWRTFNGIRGTHFCAPLHRVPSLRGRKKAEKMLFQLPKNEGREAGGGVRGRVTGIGSSGARRVSPSHVEIIRGLAVSTAADRGASSDPDGVVGGPQRESGGL